MSDLDAAESAEDAPEATRERRASEMRGRLLDAAESLYSTEGPGALTNRRIGEAAGTTTQSIYTYFGNREDMIDAMYERAIAGADEIVSLASAAISGVPNESDVIAAFKIAAHHYRAFCLRHPARLRMIRRAGTEVNSANDASEVRERIVDAVVQIGRSGTGTQTADYAARIHMTLAAIHGFVDAELDGFVNASHDPDRLFDELVHRCLAPYDLLPQEW